MRQDVHLPMLEADRLTKRYGKRPALTDCTVEIPHGRIVGLVGPNGAGKSTLLQLACGLISPTAGTLSVLGARPAANASHLARVGFVAQDAPVYGNLTVADHLRMGARLNPAWDVELANRRAAQAGLDPRQQARRLSGGQRAKLALTIAAAKRPELLILDEPAAALDPLARRGFLEDLTDFVSELGAGAVLSSHLLADVERVCDHLVVMCDSRVQLAGDVRDLLAVHYRLRAPHGVPDQLPPGTEIIHTEHAAGHSCRLVRTSGAPPGPPWTVEDVALEDLVLGYLMRASDAGAARAVTTGGEGLR